MTGIFGLVAAGGRTSCGPGDSSSEWNSVVELPRGLTISVLGVSTVGRSSSVTETTSILELSACSALSALTSYNKVKNKNRRLSRVQSVSYHLRKLQGNTAQRRFGINLTV